MFLLVGLGNPGAEYAKNRHNIGFMAIDAIAARHGFGPFRNKFQGLVADGVIGGEKTLLLKPETFMNESGRSVETARAFYKLEPTDIVVLHDEIDLEAGKVRVKRGGGHAGHNGLRSIHAHLGDAYGRLRLGIGHPGDKEKVTGHVLNDFAKADAGWVETLLDAVAENVALLIEDKDTDFMTRVAARVNPPKAGKPETGADGPDGV